MKLLAAACAFLFSGIVVSAPLHGIAVFGDSLSDDGNLYEVMNYQLPKSPPYFAGRFSNGPVWIEYLAAKYFPKDTSAHFSDYAYGGAGVSLDPKDDKVLFTLNREVEQYLGEHNQQADEDILYVIWIGANNYLGAPPEIEQTVQDVNTGIVNAANRLVQKGAKHIMLVNLPDLGRTPAAFDWNLTETMSTYSNLHNDVLSNNVAQLKSANPEVEWVFFDLNTMFSDVLDHPQENGFKNITDTCISFDAIGRKQSILGMAASALPPKTKDACDGYLFFDWVHPTGAAHQIIAEKVEQILAESGVEFSE